MSCNLLLIAQPDHIALANFEVLAHAIRAEAPDVHALALWDQPIEGQRLGPGADRPTMTFCPTPIRYFRPWRGTIYQCRRMRKSDEYVALERAAVPVPRWALLTRDAAPNLEGFGRYVVVKPDWSGKGADVKIKRRGRVRWRPPSTDYTRKLQGEHGNWIVQAFVYTGPQPVSYRVTTLFGEPLWGWKVQAALSRRALKHRDDFHDGETGGGMSIVSSGKGCVFSPVDEPDLNELARRAHGALPDVPVLAVDMVRDAETGRLYVIEVNAGGYTWHLSSSTGRKIQQDFGFDIDARFNALHRAACILAEQTRRLAR